MKILNLLILTLSFVLFTSAGSYSQNDTSRTKDKLKKIVKEKLMEKMNLDDATATKLIEITAANRKEMKELRKKEKDLTDYIFENPQSSDIGIKLDDLLNTENKINQLQNEHYTKLKSFLTPNQIAQSMVFQKELMKFMKKEMKHDKSDDRNGKEKDNRNKNGRDKDHSPGDGNRELF
jgi:hypothetical protein